MSHSFVSLRIQHPLWPGGRTLLFHSQSCTLDPSSFSLKSWQRMLGLFTASPVGVRAALCGCNLISLSNITGVGHLNPSTQLSLSHISVLPFMLPFEELDGVVVDGAELEDNATSITEGSSISVVCAIRGQPMPRAVWGYLASSNASFIPLVNSSSSSAVLSLDSVRPSQSGFYICRGSFLDATLDVFSFHLTVMSGSRGEHLFLVMCGNLVFHPSV